MKPRNPTIHSQVITAATEVKVPVIQEELVVSKREVVTGELTLKKRVELENIELDLERHDHGFDVERRTVGHSSEVRPDAIVQEAGATVYRIIEEVPVVVTHYRIVEEIVITPRTTSTSQPTIIPARREQVDIIRTPAVITDPLA